ncbi:hypothetical protein B0T24DRAFT_678513 [Lasiosphaeria ovina]|uniref:Uncharacterized protein n=1 Tax=Lasiosphaeria ovina TaxID=92902 RepID=A0AAE0N6Z3_9PEZI|nr:hypothetical protein B0T24DRAFT_678513 [Lasiosphaeria ovina]
MDTLASNVPVQQCQKWLICVLAEWERQHFTALGQAAKHARDVRFTTDAKQYEIQHLPIPDPVGIALPPSWPKPTLQYPNATVGQPALEEAAEAGPSSVVTSSGSGSGKKKGGKK